MLGGERVSVTILIKLGRRRSSGRPAPISCAADTWVPEQVGHPCLRLGWIPVGPVAFFVLVALGKGGMDAVTLVTLLGTASQEKAQRGRHSSLLHPG
jgi:hypothetical protein